MLWLEIPPDLTIMYPVDGHFSYTHLEQSRDVRCEAMLRVCTRLTSPSLSKASITLHFSRTLYSSWKSKENFHKCLYSLKILYSTVHLDLGTTCTLTNLYLMEEKIHIHKWMERLTCRQMAGNLLLLHTVCWTKSVRKGVKRTFCLPLTDCILYAGLSQVILKQLQWEGLYLVLIL